MKPAAPKAPFLPLPTIKEAFERCTRYSHARSWQKPLLDPVRFLRNQWRGRTQVRQHLGAISKQAAFHLRGFSVVNGEGVSESIAAYGLYEEELTDSFLRLIKPGQVVLDIGMHLGYYSTLFAQLVGNQGQVHAFEPTPSTRTIAAPNVNPFPNITVHPYAVWSEATTLEFNDYGVEYMAFNSFRAPRLEDRVLTPKKFQTDTITLDTFRQRLSQSVALVKVDAESAERDIIEGAHQLLRTDRPLVTLEVGDYGKGGESSKLIELIESFNYRTWKLSGERFALQQRQKSYAYDNLIFAPTEQDLSRA